MRCIAPGGLVFISLCFLSVGDIEHGVDHFMKQECLRRVCQAVVDLFTGAAVRDQAGLAQGAQMVRNGRRAHVDKDGNVGNTFLAVREQPQDLQARAVAKLAEGVRSFDKCRLRGAVFQKFFGLCRVLVIVECSQTFSGKMFHKPSFRN